ncbi:MAG: GntR family transcriptional regulator [Verrucomicrobia bacterium]|nr:GntR family transcriptional regulator [Verrucomicrobiota bacterium]
MLPFSIELKPGLPVAEQILFAVRKAVVTGQLQPGEKFPSVRALSLELKVNPNTAHKVIAALVAEGVLVTTPAVGSIVAERELGGKKERAELLGAEVEWLVVEAKKLGLDLDDVQAAVAAHWKKLGGL